MGSGCAQWATTSGLWTSSGEHKCIVSRSERRTLAHRQTLGCPRFLCVLVLWGLSLRFCCVETPRLNRWKWRLSSAVRKAMVSETVWFFSFTFDVLWKILPSHQNTLASLQSPQTRSSLCMTLCVVVSLAVSLFWVTVSFLSISWSVVLAIFLFAVKLESRALLRSGAIVSPAKLSPACARHSWYAFFLNFLVDVSQRLHWK